MTVEFSLTPYQIILGILAAAPQGMTSYEVADATGMTSYNVWSRLYKMSKRGLVEQTKEGGKARWRLPLSEPLIAHYLRKAARAASYRLGKATLGRSG